MPEHGATPAERLDAVVAELGAAPGDPTVAHARALLSAPHDAPPQLWDALAAALRWALALEAAEEASSARRS